MKGFIKSNWQKDASDVAINAALRGLGAGASAYILNTVFNGKPKEGSAQTNTASTLRNIMGPVFLGIGVMGDMMIEDEKMRAICQGIATYSMIHSVAVIAPDFADNFDITETAHSGNTGTAGLGKLGNCKSGINALGRLPRHDRKPMQLGETTMAYQGNYPEELQIAAGEKATVDTDGHSYNNDWVYLSQNVDKADAITKTLNGPVADEEAAALMGVTTNEEAALLMGMF